MDVSRFRDVLRDLGRDNDLFLPVGDLYVIALTKAFRP